MAEKQKDEYARLRPTVYLEDEDDMVRFQEIVTWEGENNARRIVEGLVNTEMETFANFMRSIGNEGLSRPERAIVKTYLAWKLGLGKEQKENA